MFFKEGKPKRVSLHTETEGVNPLNKVKAGEAIKEFKKQYPDHANDKTAMATFTKGKGRRFKVKFTPYIKV